MRFWHSLMRGSVVLLLIFVFGVGFLGVEDAYARFEITSQSNITDGDPEDGVDSAGSGGKRPIPPSKIIGTPIYTLPLFIYSQDIFGFIFFDHTNILESHFQSTIGNGHGEDHR